MHTVRRLAGMLGLMMCGFSSLVHGTSFTIEFTNGHTVVASRVWEEGPELKFDIYQGTAGVPRTLVKRIRTATLASHDRGAGPVMPLSSDDADSSRTETRAAPSAHRPADGGHAAGTLHTASGEPPAGSRTSTTDDGRADRDKKARLTSQLDDATKRHREAAAAGQLDAKQAAWDDITAYRKQLIALADDVSQKNAGVIPS
jgi:hypothetical protein